jgi:hypothetical protein
VLSRQKTVPVTGCISRALLQLLQHLLRPLCLPLPLPGLQPLLMRHRRHLQSTSRRCFPQIPILRPLSLMQCRRRRL